ncbi:hypothetical protein RD792_015841 [Penstemon davidsonii]|uniref:Shikimate dehydrogenase (NADP(+)) n=1 Tax=Penstemon davidsonii TaxID=160366 RepID=A0ABR0CJI5_9LAMI|nr:hypothetical protein RD792_015841 [Penstemon davidsonii]
MDSVGQISRMICVPIMGESVEQILNAMHQAKSLGADVVEIRLDCIDKLQFEPKRDLKLLIGNKPLPVVVVYRPIWEGGLYKGDEEARLQALFLAKDLGADYIELELKVASDFMKVYKLSQHSGSKIIVSCCVDNLRTLQEDPTNFVAKLQSTGADIIKFVLGAVNITDIAKVFDLYSHCQVPLIAYGTGERGLISQLLSFKYGGIFAYGSIEGNAIPGLPTVDSLGKVYKIENINANTQVFGLISKPVSHSKGPLLHNPTLRHMGYNGIYVPMFVDDLKDFFSVYSSADFPGFSVGIPYKEAVIDFCDEVHPLARSIGAVNTIIRRRNDRKLVGYNTDSEAAISAIEGALKGRALAFGAKTKGARVVVFDIDFDRAKALADAVSGKAFRFEDLVSFEPEKGAILANATPLGMHPNMDRIPVPEESLRDYELVFDAVYTPRKTRLLKEAEAAGAIIVSGVEMFLRQAAAQFNLFTGLKAPEEFMREIILEKF